MKIKRLLYILIVLVIASCKTDDGDDENFQVINVATPQIMTKVEFRASIEILSPQNIEEAGKIYAYGDYVFINDNLKGVHIIDNTNPEFPSAIAYIKIPGNVDISIKNNYLYADNAIDLVVFDISNMQNIELVAQLEDVFYLYDQQFPDNADEFNYGDYNYETDIIVGWTVTQERREINYDDSAFEATTNGGFNDTVGVGGSLARFQIVDDYLYTVGNFDMTIFDISNLEQPTMSNTLQAGWNIETMFYVDNYLYLGGTNGMYIYGLDNPGSPNFVSEFTHWEGCDPVVVDGDYAYLTLRGGNDCGIQESVLEIIDISNKYNPQLVATHVLDNPYGLGYKNNLLFVCDGSSGLKIYDKSDPLNLQFLSDHSNVQSKDVIALDNVLLMIGEDVLYQYNYQNGSVNLLSTYAF